MVRRIYSFEDPDRFVAGAIGQPGSRTFFLQAREGERITTVVVEKIQVAVLAERLTSLLAEVRSRGADVPEAAGLRTRSTGRRWTSRCRKLSAWAPWRSPGTSRTRRS